MILFLDTAFGVTSIAIKKDKKVYKEAINQNINISQNLVLYINNILKRVNLKKKDIRLICFNKGPGNFTSLRVSLAFVKATAFYLKIPVIALNSFQILAMSTLKPNHSFPFFVAIDARMNEVYFSEYKNYKDLFSKDHNIDLLPMNDFLKKCNNKKNSDFNLVIDNSNILKNEKILIKKDKVIELNHENIFNAIENNNTSLNTSNVNDVSILYIRNKVANKNE